MFSMLALALSLAPSAHAAPEPKAAICHQDGTGTFNVISVSANAVSAHLANHGDVLAGAYYPDADGDGYGDTFGAVRGCPAPGYTLDASDCDDTDPAANPGVDEVCGDEVDNDCDLQIDEDCEATCPCTGEPTWDAVLNEGVPVLYCIDVEEYTASWWLTATEIETDIGIIAAGLNTDTGEWTCGVASYLSNEGQFLEATEAEALACESDITAWLERNGAVCIGQ